MQYHPFSDAMVNAINEGAYIVLAARLEIRRHLCAYRCWATDYCGGNLFRCRKFRRNQSAKRK